MTAFSNSAYRTEKQRNTWLTAYVGFCVMIGIRASVTISDCKWIKDFNQSGEQGIKLPSFMQKK